PIDHYGYTPEEFLRLSLLDVCPPEGRQAFQAMLACAPHHPPARHFSQHRKKNGEVVDVEVAGSEIQLAEKRVWLASINDITERKRTEEALARAQAELADRARQ